MDISESEDILESTLWAASPSARGKPCNYPTCVMQMNFYFTVCDDHFRYLIKFSSVKCNLSMTGLSNILHQVHLNIAKNNACNNL